MFLKQGDYIQLKTGNVAKVLSVRDYVDTNFLDIRMRVFSDKGYSYQYIKSIVAIGKVKGHIDFKYNWKWVIRKFNQEDILRLVSEELR